MAPIVVVLCTLALQTGAIDSSSISGTVTNSITGAPLSKAQVIAEPVEDRRAPLVRTATDDKGHFLLDNLMPGAYLLRGRRNGYLDTYYGARRAEIRGASVTVAAGQELTGLQLKIVPSAVIAGTIRDPDGEPLIGARVALVAVRYRNGVKQVSAVGQYADTDDLGQYRIPSVEPGRYYLRAGAGHSPDDGRYVVDRLPKDSPPPMALVAAFHPGVREVAAARVIDVAAGGQYTGVDVTLVRSTLFKVRVRFEAPAGLSAGVRLEERPHLSDGLQLQAGSTCKDRVCEFSGVAAGPYWVTGSADSQNLTLQELIARSTRLQVRVPIEVSGADVDGVFVSIGAGAELSGHVVVAGEEQVDLSSAEVTLLDEEGDERTAQISKDGVFRARLSPGRYDLRVQAGKDLVVRSIRSEDTDVLSEGLTVSREGKLAVRVELARDGGTVEGIARDDRGQAIAGATVVLAPSPNLWYRRDLFQEATTDQNGSYRIRSVPPGDYVVFAWNDIEQGMWFDAEYMKSVDGSGQAVTVRRNAAETVNPILVPDNWL